MESPLPAQGFRRNILGHLNVQIVMKKQVNVGPATIGDRLEFSPSYCRMARALLNWPQVRLGAKSHLSEATIRDFESGRRILRPERVAAVRKAFESAGVVFTVQGPLLSEIPGDPLPPRLDDEQREPQPATEGKGSRARGKPRTRPLKGEEAEVRHVVAMHDVSPSQARELVRRHGNDWRKIDEAAESYRERK